MKIFSCFLLKIRLNAKISKGQIFEKLLQEGYRQFQLPCIEWINYCDQHYG